jgi:ParB-like nuclease domain
VSRNNPTPLSSDRSLTTQLMAQGRRRREDLSRSAKASQAKARFRNDILLDLAIVEVPVEQLRHLARQVRKLDPARVPEIVASIGVLGLCAPILVGRGDVIIDGEARVEAAKYLELRRSVLRRTRMASQSSI